MDEHDLQLERTIDAPIDRVWRAWTEPDQLSQWWAPRPYQIIECQLDPRPGGLFFTRMTGPDGFDSPGTGCFLEVEKERRLVWTNALGAGYRPIQPEDCGGFPFTAIATFEDLGDGRTLYRARVLHKDKADRDMHERMGFHEGWGTVADQLGEVAKRLG